MKLELIQKGNTKLPNMYMFNMTTSIVQCGRVCPGCYAAREEKRWPAVAKARQKRYEASLQLDFVSRVKAELSSIKKPFKYFRIHASSEFYSQQYLNNWHRIAKHFPNIIFYCYTKRKKDFDFSLFENEPNVIVIDSFHFKGLNYGPLDKAPPNAYICPHQKKTDIVCGESCTYCMTKQAQTNSVYFIKH